MCNSNRLCNDNDCQTCFNNSFASHEKAEFWSDKNVDENGNKINPRQVFKKTHKKYLFNCNICWHQYDTALSNLKRNRGCPYCCKPSKRICDNDNCECCREKSFASHEKSKYWSEKNRDQPEGYDGLYISPRQVIKGTDKRYWFKCNNIKCGHEFEASLDAVTGKRKCWCPYCCDPSRLLCEKEDCSSCHEKSFASHEKSKYWSDKNVDENGNSIKPMQVFKGTPYKYWFDCSECKHSFDISLYDISHNNCWCPCCSSKMLCHNNECKKCLEKSFHSHKKSEFWSDINRDQPEGYDGLYISPRQVTKRTHEKYWFNCICGHEFKKKIEHITENNSWCPYCCNTTQKLCDNKECKKCYENSFASHEKSKYWSDKNVDENGNIINPRQVVKGSGNKYCFMCEYSHDFKSSLDSIVGKNTWCPICVNKTEKKLYEHLLKIYPNIIYRFSADWCKNPITKCYLPFDFVLKEQKIIIELDGPQHFVQVMNWKTPEEQFENDQYKEKCANDNSYSVIRIIQADVWNDTYDWLIELKESIEQTINEKVIQNIYLCMNNEYENFN
jgi:very-short-patch-repair endonuclease